MHQLIDSVRAQRANQLKADKGVLPYFVTVSTKMYKDCIWKSWMRPFANCSEKSAIASIVSQILSLNFVSQKKSDSNYVSFVSIDIEIL